MKVKSKIILEIFVLIFLNFIVLLIEKKFILLIFPYSFVIGYTDILLYKRGVNPFKN